MPALAFVPHLWNSKITVALQVDDHPVGCVEVRGRYFWAAIFDEPGHPEWVGTRATRSDAQHLVVRAWDKGRRARP